MTVWTRMKWMNERVINKFSVGSGFTCVISARTLCTAIDAYGVHVGNAGNNPFTCTTCGGDGHIESLTTFYPTVTILAGDERIVTEAGILTKGDAVLQVKTGYTLGDEDKLTIDSQPYKRIHYKPDMIKTFEAWYCKFMVGE